MHRETLIFVIEVHVARTLQAVPRESGIERFNSTGLLRWEITSPVLGSPSANSAFPWIWAKRIKRC